MWMGEAQDDALALLLEGGGLLVGHGEVDELHGRRLAVRGCAVDVFFRLTGDLVRAKLQERGLLDPA